MSQSAAVDGASEPGQNSRREPNCLALHAPPCSRRAEADCGTFLRLQDHGLDVWFRNLRLRTIPPEEKLTRFPFTPMPVPPTALEKENERVRQMLKAKEQK